MTGASSGIGREVASLLARRGYRTILLARRRELLEQLAGELSAFAPSAVEAVDLLDTAAIPSAMLRLQAEHGPIDVLVNNAGVGCCRPFLEQSADDQRLLFEVHYFAAAALIRAALPAMLERGSGHVINVTSISAKIGPWGHSSYAAAKSAVVTLTQSLAAEYGGRGIHFSYVKPGVVRTDFFNGPGYDQLSEQVRRHGISATRVAKAIVRLLDKPRLELCVPRLYRVLDWIKAINPAWAHRLVARGSRPANQRNGDAPPPSKR